MIDVQQIDNSTFEVTVKGRVTTKHSVTVDPSYYEKLSGKRVPPATLVENPSNSFSNENPTPAS